MVTVKKISVAFVLVAVIILGAFIYWTSANLPANSSDHSNKIFVINKGEAIRQIGNNLKAQGLIRDPVAFFVYIKLNHQDKNIQAGDYRLSPSMSLARVIDTINHGTLDVWVTIPEGIRAEEIADIFEKNLPSYKSSWRDKLDAQEGYLFPDTYLIPRDAEVDMVIAMMKNNFSRRIESVHLSLADARIARVITIASLIEREAKLTEDIPIVSSVIQNRLTLGMKLDVDATIQYALGYQVGEKRWWKKELSKDDIALNSPYNSYRNAGLPPTPIGNPGLNAIRAALNPANTDYLYYVSDKKGKIPPATTIQEHNANIKKYL